MPHREPCVQSIQRSTTDILIGSRPIPCDCTGTSRRPVVTQGMSQPGSRACGKTPLESDQCHSLSHAYQTYLKDDRQEQNHWEDVCRSYRQYATFAMQQWVNHQYRLHDLPEAQRQLLPPGLRQETREFQSRSNAFKDAAIRNQFCLDCILRHAGQPHSQEIQQPFFSSDPQMSKVSSVLKSLARDWSSEGSVERDMAYPPIIEKVKEYLPQGSSPRRLCVPGAGVGRLACELAAAGYSVQGNEFSLYMLLASDYLLNGPLHPSTPLAISPYLLESRNVHSVEDPTRIVYIPDVDPFSMIMSKRSGKNGRGKTSLSLMDIDEEDRKMINSSKKVTGQVPKERAAESQAPEFSMAAGEFISIYSSEHEIDKWDGCVACFFLDASPSIVEYLLVIFQMLKPGGCLFNFGPLLWHWSGPAMRPDDDNVQAYRKRFEYLDPKYLTSIDLPWEDVQVILRNIGFEIIESSCGHPALYTADRRSMMNLQYKCVQFVARKPATPPK